MDSPEITAAYKELTAGKAPGYLEWMASMDIPTDGTSYLIWRAAYGAALSRIAAEETP